MSNNIGPIEAMHALQEFAATIDNVVSDLDESIGHMQSLEHELGGEEAKVKKYAKYVKAEAVRNQQGEEFRKDELAEVAAKSEDLERTVEKVNGDLEHELSELTEIGNEMQELHEMAEVAEEALEVLKNYSEN